MIFRVLLLNGCVSFVMYSLSSSHRNISHLVLVVSCCIPSAGKSQLVAVQGRCTSIPEAYFLVEPKG